MAFPSSFLIMRPTKLRHNSFNFVAYLAYFISYPLVGPPTISPSYQLHLYRSYCDSCFSADNVSRPLIFKLSSIRAFHRLGASLSE